MKFHSDRPLNEKETKTLRELPLYWRMLDNAQASRKLLVARIRALVLLAEGQDDRIAILRSQVARFTAENEVLRDEIRTLRCRRVWPPFLKKERPEGKGNLGPPENENGERT